MVGENTSMSTIVSATTSDYRTLTNSTAKIYTRADLEAANDEMARTLSPAMALLGILMVLGICGNSLVCYVFCFRLKRGTQHFLIVCLAVFDLLSCTISIPNEIADMRYFYMFQSEAACKIMRFINTFTAIGSTLTLMVIAVDRFRKVCRPFKQQMHLRHAQLSLIPVVGGASFFSWPAIIMYGLRTTDAGIPGVPGQDCSTPDGVKDTIYPLVYNGILFIAFIVLVTALIVIYCCILREINRHNRYMKRNSDYSLPSSGQNNTDLSSASTEMPPRGTRIHSLPSNGEEELVAPDVGEMSGELIHLGGTYFENSVFQNGLDESKLTKEETRIHAHEDIVFGPSDHPGSAPPTSNPDSSYDQATVEPNVENAAPEKSSYTTQKSTSRLEVQFKEETPNKKNRDESPGPHNKRRSRGSKTTVIAFLVTLVFILSFLPHLCLQVAKLVKKGFDYNLEGAGLVLYNIFLRSYFINSVSNPIIYGVLNPRFGSEVKALARRLRFWKK